MGALRVKTHRGRGAKYYSGVAREKVAGELSNPEGGICSLRKSRTMPGIRDRTYKDKGALSKGKFQGTRSRKSERGDSIHTHEGTNATKTC